VPATAVAAIRLFSIGIAFPVPLDAELLPRLDAVHPPELCRQNDLALGGMQCPQYCSWAAYREFS